ncbi:four helix bundle protein [candidate division KSB1 bacterium]|nr:four helix bundle protein [candidate division KSB1 bacterium]
MLIKILPEEEKYNLKSQMRRAKLSVTNNIAEGYGRYHYQENISRIIGIVNQEDLYVN